MMRILFAVVLIFSAVSDVATRAYAQSEDPLPGWYSEPVPCDLEMRTQDELIEIGENPPDDLNASRVAAEAEMLAEENNVEATPGIVNVTYTTFEEPDAEPVSNEDFASIQAFLRYFETCSALPGALGVTSLMTDDYAAFRVNESATGDGLSVEDYVTQQSAATPEPSPSPNEYFNFRALWLAYQAWDIGGDEVLATVGFTLYLSGGDYDDQATAIAPPPDEMLFLLAITLERNGSSWLWADLNASLDPALVNVRV